MTRPTYPFTATPGGSLELTRKRSDKASQAILQSIQTEQEERVLRPSYGREPNPFDIYDPATLQGSLRASIEKGLEGHPGVSFELRGYMEDDGVMGVNAIYAVDDDPVGEVYVRLPGTY